MNQAFWSSGHGIYCVKLLGTGGRAAVGSAVAEWLGYIRRPSKMRVTPSWNRPHHAWVATVPGAGARGGARRRRRRIRVVHAQIVVIRRMTPRLRYCP